MRLTFRMISLLVLFAVFVGCGNSESFTFTSTNNGPRVSTNAMVRIQHLLARQVPSSVSTYRISGFDTTGTLIFTPADFPKSADLVVEMSPSVTNVAILYLDGNNIPQGAFMQEVELIAGQTTNILDPDSVYSSGMPGPPPTSTTWHNNECPLDVNGDRTVTPLDALAVINDLNQNGSRQLTDFTSQPFPPPPFLDVNADGSVTANDVLLIMNALNGGSVPSCPPAVVPTKLTFQNQPQDVIAGATMNPIEVRIVDESNRVDIRNFTQVVTISFVDPGGFTLSGTTTRTALKGVVVFDDLSINQAGPQVLKVESVGLSSAETDTFTISDL